MTADNEFQRWVNFLLNSLGIVVYLKRLISSTNKTHKVLYICGFQRRYYNVHRHFISI